MIIICNHEYYRLLKLSISTGGLIGASATIFEIRGFAQDTFYIICNVLVICIDWCVRVFLFELFCPALCYLHVLYLFLSEIGFGSCGLK